MGLWDMIRTAASGQEEDPFFQATPVDDYQHFIRSKPRLEAVQQQVSRTFGAPHHDETHSGIHGVRRMHLDTGHGVQTQLDPSGHWIAHLTPPGWPGESSVHGSRTLGLGTSDEDVPGC